MKNDEKGSECHKEMPWGGKAIPCGSTPLTFYRLPDTVYSEIRRAKLNTNIPQTKP